LLVFAQEERAAEGAKEKEKEKEKDKK
jgi:hypothetical protein